MADIKYVIEVDEQGAIKKIQDVGTALDELSGKSEEAAEKKSSLWKQFAIGTTVATAVIAALKKAKDAFEEMIRASAEAEAVDRNLQAALETTGRTASALIPHFRKLAEEIQRETVYSDEAVKSAETLLIQLTNLDRKGIEAATRGAVGLASVLKIDLQSAAMMVAKAMMGHTEALSRYGISVKENASLEEKRAELLNRLAGFYERAKAETDTFSGAQAQLKNAFDDLKEKVGDVIVKNQDFVNLIKQITEKITSLAQSKDFQLWLSAISEELSAIFKAATKAVEGIAKFGEAIGTFIAHPFKSAQKESEELAESFRRLEEAKKRAQEAGHYLKQQTDNLTQANQNAKEKINETGTAIKMTAEEAEKAAKKKKELEDKMKKLAEETKKTEKNMYDFATAMAKVKDSAIKNLDPMFKMFDSMLREMAEPKKYEDIINANNSMLDAIAERYKNSKEEIVKPMRESTSEIKHYFDGLFNDIARGLGKLIEKWLEGGLTLKNFMKGIWEEIKESFFRMIGEMVSSWIIDKFKSLFESMGKSLIDSVSNAVNSVAKTVTSIAQGASSAVSGIWMALGSAVGSFLGNILSGGGWGATEKHWVQQQLDIMKNIQSGWLPAFITKLDEIKDILGNGINVALGYQNALLEDISAAASGIREATYGMWDVLKGLKKAQYGFEGVVSRPTLFVAGEAGPERVIIQPSSPTYHNNSRINLVFNISGGGDIVSITKTKIIPIIQEYLDRAILKVPAMAVGK